MIEGLPVKDNSNDLTSRSDLKHIYWRRHGG